jgi:hypothetical protein
VAVTSSVLVWVQTRVDVSVSVTRIVEIQKSEVLGEVPVLGGDISCLLVRI